MVPSECVSHLLATIYGQILPPFAGFIVDIGRCAGLRSRQKVESLGETPPTPFHFSRADIGEVTCYPVSALLKWEEFPLNV